MMTTQNLPSKLYPYDHSCKNLAYRIAIAADQEAIWCADIFKFPDLVAKYGLPSGAEGPGGGTIHAAEKLTRQITLDMIEHINDRARARRQSILQTPKAPPKKAPPKRTSQNA